MNHRKSRTSSSPYPVDERRRATALCCAAAVGLLAWTFSDGVSAQPAAAEQGGAGFVEGEDIGGGARLAVYGAEQWFANHNVEWRAKAAHCKAHLEAARAEENQALAIRQVMTDTRRQTRDLIDEFNAHIGRRGEHLEAFRDCSNEATRYRPENADRPPYYFGRPDPPVDFAQGVAKGVRDGFNDDRLWYATGPAAGKALQKLGLVGGALAAIGAGTTAADMVRTAQEINPSLDPYDFGHKVGQLIYQGADLKDAVTHAAAAAASPPPPARARGAGAPPASGDDLPTVPTDPGAGPSARGPPTGAPIANGSFGTVYQYPGNADLVVKHVDRPRVTPEIAAQAVRGQQHGHDLIAAANASPNAPGTDIPTTKIIESDPNGQPPSMVMENIYGPTWRGKGAYVVPSGEPLADEEIAAANELAKNMADKGLVWLDPNRGNVFYFFEGNTLRAGVLDHDFIYTAAELEAELTMPQSLGQSVFAGKWQTSQAIQDWYSDFRDTGVVDPRTLMDAIMQAHNYR